MLKISDMNTEETSEYIPVIGLEIHAELKTKTKMFCSCINDPYERNANINICPICMAHPGTLPTLNKQAIQNVLKVGLAVDAEIAEGGDAVAEVVESRHVVAGVEQGAAQN